MRSVSLGNSFRILQMEGCKISKNKNARRKKGRKEQEKWPKDRR